jgi:hypothetical protein
MVLLLREVRRIIRVGYPRKKKANKQTKEEMRVKERWARALERERKKRGEGEGV